MFDVIYRTIVRFAEQFYGESEDDASYDLEALAHSIADALDNKYFAKTMWCDEDIADAFHNIGIHNYTDEMIAEARKFWRVKYIEEVMCSDGFWIIDDAVRHVADEMELEGEDE